MCEHQGKRKNSQKGIYDVALGMSENVFSFLICLTNRVRDIPGSASTNTVMVTELALSISMFEGRIPSWESVWVEDSS